MIKLLIIRPFLSFLGKGFSERKLTRSVENQSFASTQTPGHNTQLCESDLQDRHLAQTPCPIILLLLSTIFVNTIVR